MSRSTVLHAPIVLGSNELKHEHTADKFDAHKITTKSVFCQRMPSALPPPPPSRLRRRIGINHPSENPWREVNHRMNSLFLKIYARVCVETSAFPSSWSLVNVSTFKHGAYTRDESHDPPPPPHHPPRLPVSHSSAARSS